MKVRVTDMAERGVGVGEREEEGGIDFYKDKNVLQYIK